MLLFGLGLMATVLRKMPETLGERPADPASLRSMLSSYRDMLRNREFVIYLSICAAAYTGVLCWLSGAPFVLQSLLGLSPLLFSITFSIGAIGYLIGTMIATRIVTRAGIVRVIGYGALMMVLGGLAMCASVALDMASANILVAAMSIWLIGLGLVFPQALAGGLSLFRRSRRGSVLAARLQPATGGGRRRIAGGGDGRQVGMAAGDRGC